jgi:transposase
MPRQPLTCAFLVRTLFGMDALSNDSRQARGLALVRGKAKAFRHVAGDVFFVPSQTATSSGQGYVVNVTSGECSCPDYEERRGVCKHQWAVRYFRHELTMPDGNTVVTESVRISYPQNWPAYNAAQVNERDTVRILASSLCDGVVQPEQKMGRPRFLLRDVVYGAMMKVYGTMSGRRSMSDLRACEAMGYVGRAPAYNTIFKYMESPDLLPVLKKLVDESAKPLAAVERNFAVDATGFATPTYVRWFDYKHGEDRRVQQWVKLHAMVGVKTGIITAAEVTPGSVNDSPMFAPLVKRTAANGFTLKEVSADKAYLSHANLAVVESVGAQPFVPFKINSTATGSPAWERLYHLFSLNNEEFGKHYHLRSNVESEFSSMKRLFGSSVRSKCTAAQFNEVALKCLVANVTTLVHAIHELGVEPKFWLPKAS